MTNAQPPGGEHDDPLRRVVAEYWDDIQRRADPGQLQRLTDLLAGIAAGDPGAARAALADELLDLLPPGHPVIRKLRSGAAFSGGRKTGRAASQLSGRIESIVLARTGAGLIPVTIYLADEPVHARVQAAVETLLETAGLRIEDRADPIIGSWFRRMTARANDAARSAVSQDAVFTAVHALDSHLVLGQDADTTAKLMQNLGPVVSSLHDTENAVIRAGALLIVKADSAVTVFQLTAAQQARMDHYPQLASSPYGVVAALGLTSGTSPEQPDDAAADLYVQEPVLGRDGRFLRETGVSFGRPWVAPVPDDELPLLYQRRSGLERIRLTAMVLPFDLDEPPDGYRYTEATVRMTFDHPGVCSRRLSQPPAADTGDDQPADSLLDTSGKGRQELTWTLTARSELTGLRARGREVLAVLESPLGLQRLTGTLDARVSFIIRMFDEEQKSTAERPHPLRFALDIADGTFETFSDRDLAAPQ